MIERVIINMIFEKIANREENNTFSLKKLIANIAIHNSIIIIRKITGIESISLSPIPLSSLLGLKLNHGKNKDIMPIKAPIIESLSRLIESEMLSLLIKVFLIYESLCA